MNRYKLAAKLTPLIATPLPKTNIPPKGADLAKPEITIMPRELKAPRNPNTRELSARVVRKGCDVDEILIPPIVNIQRDLEPYLPKLQAMWTVWLGLNKERRVLTFRCQTKQNRDETDDMVSDRHRQEFRYIFLSWVQDCLFCQHSGDFMMFHCYHYKDETEGWRRMSEEVAVDLKERFIDRGVWS